MLAEKTEQEAQLREVLAELQNEIDLKDDEYN
eukprot:CAMPEP_0116873506 /NCGR_PEP_ID=MMETSP0463-20121206/4682_1 /TAXON_ID=181622 /ORGANISM="Strombidinopsis sp, Strain SopsisLIS2011" /LENGTH=31 /DNA_ID= /DNA_START= /DNA_END= /DNA_ORIENTATION=